MFTFERKPPHHELYDSIFHGDELNPARVTIKLGIGDGGQYSNAEIGVNEAGRNTEMSQEVMSDGGIDGFGGNDEDERSVDTSNSNNNYAVNANDDMVDDLEGALGKGGAPYSSGNGEDGIKLFDIANGTTVDDVDVHDTDLDQVQVMSARILELEANEKRLQKSLQSALMMQRN